MESDELRRRTLIALRLKALRELLGHAEPADNKLGYRLKAMTTDELAARGDLREDAITGSLLASMERMERHTTKMELRAIADALGLPVDYFTRPDRLSVVTGPPEGGRPPGPPDELFRARTVDQPRRDTSPDGQSHPGMDARRDNG